MTEPAAIAYNLSWLQPGRVGGTETYARRLLTALHTHAPELALHVCAGPAATGSLAAGIGGVEWHRLPAPTDRLAGRLLVERTVLARRFRDIGADVDHHLGGTVPGRPKRPTVVTIHDLQPLEHPANFGAVKQRWLARAIPRAVTRAEVVVTPSEWVARSVIDRFGVDPTRVRPVPVYAAAPDRSDATGARSPASARVRELLDRGPVLLYPAMTMAHKNHSTLFRAFARAVQIRPDLQLACIGPEGRDHGAITGMAVDCSPQIHLLGFVSTSDLATLYDEAEMLVFPSRYEGFGLPILEAQQASLLVIASSAAAIPEVGGAGVQLVDPDDVDAWTEHIARQPSPSERADRIAAGLANVARYTAARTADAQIDAYRLAIDQARAS